jgi:hypothetical protein
MFSVNDCVISNKHYRALYWYSNFSQSFLLYYLHQLSSTPNTSMRRIIVISQIRVHVAQRSKTSNANINCSPQAQSNSTQIFWQYIYIYIYICSLTPLSSSEKSCKEQIRLVTKNCILLSKVRRQCWHQSVESGVQETRSNSKYSSLFCIAAPKSRLR